MKKTAILFLITLSLAVSSCKKDDDSNPTSLINSTNMESVPGSWKISYYYDKDKEETSNYANYTFNFSADGNLTATGSSQTFQGTWQTTVDDNLPRLVISISGNNDMLELSDDWVVNNISSTEIWLVDDNTTHLEELKFVKTN